MVLTLAVTVWPLWQLLGGKPDWYPRWGAGLAHHGQELV